MTHSDQAVEANLLSKYTECMEEIKKRTEVVRGFLTRECNAMYVQTTAESVALQVRKVLELIALASLVANRSEYAKLRKSFRTDWNAKGIFKTLKKANPSFYPTPNRQVVDRETGKVNSIEDIKSGFLTEDDYLSLFDSCCDILHAENPFSAKRNAMDFLNGVPAWMEKIRRLLNHHTIQLTDDDRQLWVLMQAESDGNVHVWEFKRVPEGEVGFGA